MSLKNSFIELVKISINKHSGIVDEQMAAYVLLQAQLISESSIPPPQEDHCKRLRLPSLDVAAVEFVRWAAKNYRLRNVPAPGWVEFGSYN